MKELDRLISVAQMMDWTDDPYSNRQISYLCSRQNDRSLYVAPVPSAVNLPLVCATSSGFDPV